MLEVLASVSHFAGKNLNTLREGNWDCQLVGVLYICKLAVLSFENPNPGTACQWNKEQNKEPRSSRAVLSDSATPSNFYALKIT